MSDGLLVPRRHDGMAAFRGLGTTTILVRNHEVDSDAEVSAGAFGADLSLLEQVDPDLLYDRGTGGRPALGGTTTLVFDTATGALETHYLSLAGTLRNCAGGPTPWGSWLSCEETVELAGGALSKDHGYVFEVQASPVPGLRRASPITSMGRFNHEAVAVHPSSAVVYLTEDRTDGLFYRFVANVAGDLSRGGRLQALSVEGQPSLDTRNFSPPEVASGVSMNSSWLDLENVEDPEGDLRFRGFDAGAARFARGEGIWYGDDEVFFACTNGGAARKGQIWRYRPSPWEGTPAEMTMPGRLELFVESHEAAIIENADNLTVAPWGDLIVCEDSSGVDHVVGVTPLGEVYKLARNESSDGEFAGVCFSPEGSTMFVNLQKEALTVAITGPWGARL